MAAVALPDTGSLALHGVPSAEGAGVTDSMLILRSLVRGAVYVPGVLLSLDLLDLLTQRSTVSAEWLDIDCSGGLVISHLDRKKSCGRMCIPRSVFTGDADLCRN